MVGLTSDRWTSFMQNEIIIITLLLVLFMVLFSLGLVGFFSTNIKFWLFWINLDHSLDFGYIENSSDNNSTLGTVHNWRHSTLKDLLHATSICDNEP
jgi:hypothetical protein